MRFSWIFEAFCEVMWVVHGDWHWSAWKTEKMHSRWLCANWPYIN